MAKDGGTQIYCPTCREYTNCKVIWWGETFNGNFRIEDDLNISWRQRPRRCDVCFDEFLTCEVEKTFFDEFIKIRAKVEKLKRILDED
jgi:phage host-nuclease inhibitor protein Gam